MGGYVSVLPTAVQSEIGPEKFGAKIGLVYTGTAIRAVVVPAIAAYILYHFESPRSIDCLSLMMHVVVAIYGGLFLVMFLRWTGQ